MIVIDSSALAKFILREEGWEEVEGFLAGGVLTVELALKEVGNALWVRTRREGLDHDYVLEVCRELLKASFIVLANQKELLPDAMHIALRHGLTVYDAIFVALALKEGLPLLTADRQQAKAAQEEGLEVVFIG